MRPRMTPRSWNSRLPRHPRHHHLRHPRHHHPLHLRRPHRHPPRRTDLRRVRPRRRPRCHRRCRLRRLRCMRRDTGKCFPTRCPRHSNPGDAGIAGRWWYHRPHTTRHHRLHLRPAVRSHPGKCLPRTPLRNLRSNRHSSRSRRRRRRRRSHKDRLVDYTHWHMGLRRIRGRNWVRTQTRTGDRPSVR
jgi:hypothetical protein